MCIFTASSIFSLEKRALQLNDKPNGNLKPAVATRDVFRLISTPIEISSLFLRAWQGYE